ncbi:hypothetical protein KNQ94_07160 [Acinetobacter baumannii]|nr:hypothetical protein [Acinetobacter baumannii]
MNQRIEKYKLSQAFRDGSKAFVAFWIITFIAFAFLKGCADEQHVNELPDEFDEIMDDADLSKWQPLAPHGFFLMSIYFTEDGADAIWAKEKQVEGAEE